MSHTPKPWKATQDVDTRGRDTWRIDSPTIGLMAVLTIGDKELAGEVGDNARLMVAAPDLLGACQSAESWLGEYDTQHGDCDLDSQDEGLSGLLKDIRAAIAKAKGE